MITVETAKKIMIPCKVRIPKEGVFCLVLYSDKIYPAVITRFQNELLWYIQDGRNYTTQEIVTHWLDLSTLTTKDLAKNLARQAYNVGESHGARPNALVARGYKDFTDFITKEEGLL